MYCKSKFNFESIVIPLTFFFSLNFPRHSNHVSQSPENRTKLNDRKIRWNAKWIMSNARNKWIKFRKKRKTIIVQIYRKKISRLNAGDDHGFSISKMLRFFA